MEDFIKLIFLYHRWQAVTDPVLFPCFGRCLEYAPMPRRTSSSEQQVTVSISISRREMTTNQGQFHWTIGLTESLIGYLSIPNGNHNTIILSLCICWKHKEESTAQVQCEKSNGELRLFLPDLILMPFLTLHLCLPQQVVWLYGNSSSWMIY